MCVRRKTPTKGGPSSGRVDGACRPFLEPSGTSRKTRERPTRDTGPGVGPSFRMDSSETKTKTKTKGFREQGLTVETRKERFIVTQLSSPGSGNLVFVGTFIPKRPLPDPWVTTESDT